MNVPISQFSDGLQKVLSFLPGTYGTSMLRNHALHGVFEEMSDHGFPDQVIESIRDSVDCNIYFYGDKVSIGNMHIILAASIAILVALYVLMNVIKAKREK